MKKLITTISQAIMQNGDLDEVVEEAGEAHQPRDRGQDRLARIDADLSELAGLEKLGGGDRAAAGLQAEPGERVVDDLGEIVVVANDEGEDADVEGLLDQPGEHVLVRRHRPEKAGERNVDRDENAGEPAHIALHQAEAGIDVLGEGREETVDDAWAAHGAYRSSGLGSASCCGAVRAPLSAGRSVKKRRRFSAQAAAQATSFCAAIPIDWQRASSAARGSPDGFSRAVFGSGSAL